MISDYLCLSVLDSWGRSMQVNEDHMTGAVFSDTLEVLGWTKLEKSRRKYLIQCSICKGDPELFGDGRFETSLESLKKGYKPCGCGRGYRWSEEQVKTLMKRKASELGVEFVRFSEEFWGVRTRCIMRCSSGEWVTTVYRFVHKGQLGFNRGLARKDDTEMIQSFFASGVFHQDTEFLRERVGGRWHWRVKCPVCKEEGVSQPQHLQRGCRPCRCGNYKQVYSYIHAIYDGNICLAVKVGISRSKELRLKYQARRTPFRVESIGVWEYGDKLSCVQAEKECLSKFLFGILNKEEFGDGYTETTYPYNVDSIIRIFERFGGVRVK